MDAAIPPTGKREADPPTAEEEPDSKKLKHGEEEDKADHPDLKEVFERLRSECRTESKARGKLMEYVVFCKRRLTPEEEIFLGKVIQGDRPPLPSLTSPPSPDRMMPPSPNSDDEQGYDSHDGLPNGYSWVSYDPVLLPGRKDFAMKMWCARCGKAKDHWPNKCPEKKGTLFKRYGWINCSTSTSTE